jgi:hypothetical protein
MVKWTFGVVVLTIAVLLPASPAVAGSSAACVTVHIQVPFRLPDGIVHPAGALTLCDSRTYSPVASLHQVLVDGETIGLFQSRRRGTEFGGDAAAPEVVFERDLEGVLALVGYILPDKGHGIAFKMNGVNESWKFARRPRAAGGSAPVAALLTVSSAH